MRRETLATLSASRAVFERMVTIAGLDVGDGTYYDEMLVRVTEDSVETPAGKRDTTLAAYCTVSAAAFDEVVIAVEEPPTAIFDIEAAVGWLRWLEGEDVEVALLGDPDAAFADTLELRTSAETVSIACHRGPEILSQVTMELPSRFDAAERFRLEDGSFAPTTIETTAGALERIADAVDLAETVDGYPITVVDDELVLEVGSELALAHAETTLDATVSGRDVDNRYGVELAAVSRALDGDLLLQTGPGEPLVVVQTHDDFTLRYVVLPTSW